MQSNRSAATAGTSFALDSYQPALQRRPIAPAGQQRDAIDKAVNWFRDPTAPQVFRLFGYAGTGKTTIAQHIVETLDISDTVLYAAFSGKAAHVLRSKGCDGASTIHSLIYTPVSTSRAELDRLTALRDTTNDTALRATLNTLIRIEETKLDRPRFELKTDSDLISASLLIVDEVSMVNGDIAHDLLSFGTKILVLGDPAQLPPVDGAGYFINAVPDAMLTEIHRSALNSPVTRIATAVRSAPEGDWNLGVHGPDGDCGRRRDVRAHDLLDYDQVIVGTNATRWALTELVRGMLGRYDTMPIRGDRVMTLVNSPDAAVLNGQQYTVVDAAPAPDHAEQYRLTVADDEGGERDMTVWQSGFASWEGEKAAKRRGRSKVAVATFGHVITCHKSQGSQWDRVLVVDESGAFRAMTYKQHLTRLGHDGATLEAHITARRWLYTAVTRAAQQAVITEKSALAVTAAQALNTARR